MSPLQGAFWVNHYVPGVAGVPGPDNFHARPHPTLIACPRFTSLFSFVKHPRDGKLKFARQDEKIE